MINNIVVKFFIAFLLSSYFLIAEAKTYTHADIVFPVKKFSEFGVDPNQIVNLIGEGQLVLNSHPESFTTWDAQNNVLKEYKNKRVGYAFSVIRAPADEIRDMVWDMGSQGEYSPLLRKSKNLETKNNIRFAKFKQIIKTPVMTLASTFVWQLERLDNGDIATYLIDKGDVGSIFQYWQFFKLNEKETLVVLTGWQDIDTATFSYKLMVDSEPALGKVFPLLTLYERLVQFKLEAEKRLGTTLDKSDKSYDIRTINSFLSEKEHADLNELKKLNDLGSLLFFQEARTLRKSEDYDSVDIVQVSALQYIPYPKEQVKPYIDSLEGLPEFNELTQFYKTKKELKENFDHLGIQVKFGLIKIPVHIYVNMEGYGEDRYVFSTVPHAYMYPLFGHIEHLDMDDGKGTFVEVTIGGVMGPKASFLFKLSRYLPFSNVLISATYTMLTAEGAKPWLDKKMKEVSDKP